MSHHNSYFIFLVSILVIGFMSANFDAVAVGKFFFAQAGSAIGVSASVPPNPFNTLAKQLNDKENELALKEKSLVSREEALKKNDNNLLVYAAVGALSLLMSAHFYFDFKRQKQSVGV